MSRHSIALEDQANRSIKLSIIHKDGRSYGAVYLRSDVAEDAALSALEAKYAVQNVYDADENCIMFPLPRSFEDQCDSAVMGQIARYQEAFSEFTPYVIPLEMLARVPDVTGGIVEATGCFLVRMPAKAYNALADLHNSGAFGLLSLIKINKVEVPAGPATPEGKFFYHCLERGMETALIYATGSILVVPALLSYINTDGTVAEKLSSAVVTGVLHGISSKATHGLLKGASERKKLLITGAEVIAVHNLTEAVHGVAECIVGEEEEPEAAGTVPTFFQTAANKKKEEKIKFGFDLALYGGSSVGITAVAAITMTPISWPVLAIGAGWLGACKLVSGFFESRQKKQDKKFQGALDHTQNDWREVDGIYTWIRRRYIQISALASRVEIEARYGELLDDIRGLRDGFIPDKRSALERRHSKNIPREIAHPLFEIYDAMTQNLAKLELNIQINLATREELLGMLRGDLEEYDRDIALSRFTQLITLEIHAACISSDLDEAQSLCEEGLRLNPENAGLLQWRDKRFSFVKKSLVIVIS